ncbi:ClpXP protease specificity-enhancing factor SspB [Phenylobacterium ferrooxidans]|uniref:ClpXP protease specificity-enhancing factor SspB n=1 Tax=Phenylobacterium ferrooxidans TaxID=2982689 RepID=A0ABW6CQ39_9CAUL
MVTPKASDAAGRAQVKRKRNPKIGPPPIRTIRLKLANKRRDGEGVGKAIVFSIDAKHPGVILPAPLSGSEAAKLNFVLQHQFADLRDDADAFRVRLSVKGEWDELVVPYSALIDFYERADVQPIAEGAPFSSADIPLEPQAIRSALETKSKVGPSDTLGIQLNFPAERATFQPAARATGAFELIIDNNYWDLVVDETQFAITVEGPQGRQRITVPYDAVEEAFAFSYLGESGLEPLGLEVVTINKDELGKAESQLRTGLVEALIGIKPSLAIAVFLTAATLAVASSALILVAAYDHKVPATHIAFFSYISPQLMAAFKAGHIPLSTFLTDKAILGGLSALWSALLAVTALSLVLPMHDPKPMHMQAGIRGFFFAYVIVLLIYGGFTISFRYLPGVLRILWIIVVYALGERLKRAYPPKRMGAEHFSQMVDGLFAIAASLIIAQGIDKTYDQALSGPAYVLIYFLIMLVFGRWMVRGMLMQQMARADMMAPNIELPEGGGPRWRQAGNAAVGILSQFRRRRERLVMLSFEELLGEYKRQLHGEERKLFANASLRDATPGMVGLLFAAMLVWSVLVMFAIWGAANIDLYILGVGR